MPWTPSDAPRHTEKARTERLRQLWARVANAALKRGQPDDVAIREANAIVARESRQEAAYPGGHRWL